jgi:hypothetical protein
VEVTDSGKHSSLLQYRMNYNHFKFYETGLWPIFEKVMTRKSFVLFLQTILKGLGIVFNAE